MLKLSDEMLSSHAISIPSMRNRPEVDVEVNSLIGDIVQSGFMEELGPEELFPFFDAWEDEARSPDTTVVDNKNEMPVKITENPAQTAAKPQVVRNLVQLIPPMSDDPKGSCKSKNAIAAKENRIKKKKYVEDLEKSNNELKTENEKLKSSLQQEKETCGLYHNEVIYLRNVLANSKEISELVKCVRSTPTGSKLACPSLKRQSSHPLDVSNQVPAAKAARTTRQSTGPGTRSIIKLGPTSCTSGGGTGKEQRAVGGVCLHVVNGQVSLEFCPQCSSSATHFWLQQQQQQQSDEQPE